ncbi:mitochondrial peptide methionine sulfoxide reductase isoform X3 [Etheostoma cragini]|uniref:mitochondrial peptide methionine sulfoxide reductase isoform X3 n=1 Tax=Etheostoma cragini TaxID=417921 RepID=UPI00155DDFEE|nr:mitochondrial peptide methionine sulfoxide reductase isoform X3 [Etheostoma cragini]
MILGIGAIGRNQVSDTRCNVTTISDNTSCHLRTAKYVCVFEEPNVSEPDFDGRLTSESTPSQRKAVPRQVTTKHDVNGNRTVPPFPEGTEMAVFGRTGHAEVVRVVFHPEKTSFANLLAVFWESHNPTQGMRQGNDIGTAYRSVIYTDTKQQLEEALASKDQYQKVLTEEGFGAITTEIAEAKPFYYAEDYHQQYLSKNPNGYCGLGGTGVACPIGIKTKA